MSSRRGSSFGHNRERKVKALLEEEGWFVIRAPASLGAADLVALKRFQMPRMIEVKGEARGPYNGFPPGDRQALSAVARRAGAVAELAWWPPNGKLKWIPESEWPASREPASEEAA